MSWSGRISIPKGTAYREAEKQVVDLAVAGQPASDAAEEAIQTAKMMVINVLASGAVTGSHVDEPLRHGISVSISGHANPGHDPAPGWSNDSMTVSVYQVGEPASQAAGI